MEQDIFKASELIKSQGENKTLLTYIKEINSLLTNINKLKGNVQSQVPGNNKLFNSDLNNTLNYGTAIKPGTLVKNKAQVPSKAPESDKNTIVIKKDKVSIEKYLNKGINVLDKIKFLIGDVKISELKPLYERDKDKIINIILGAL